MVELSQKTIDALYEHFEFNYRIPKRVLAELDQIARDGSSRHVSYAPSGILVYRGGRRSRKEFVGGPGSSWSRSRSVADGYHVVGGNDVTYMAKLEHGDALDGTKLAKHVGAHRQLVDREVIALRPLLATLAPTSSSKSIKSRLLR
jgi:hypothetical protein